MPDIISAGFSGFKDIIIYLSKRSKSKDIIANNILRELRDNLKLLEHRNVSGINQKVLVESLRTDAIEKAFAENYNFNLLNSKMRLTESMLIHLNQSKYINWDVKRFIFSIEGKIKGLKHLHNIYPDIAIAPVNISQRLNNLFYQLLQLSAFIYSTRK